MKQILNRLFEHQSLTRDEATEVMSKIAAGVFNESEVAAFITVFLMRNVELDELIGFRDALLSLAIQVDFSEFHTIDIVGTGGDGKNTFNISTAASFVVAGAGYPVAKHGNYGATAVCGSSNVLEYFGAKFTTNEYVLKSSLEKSNFTFLHAPIFNPAMKNVAQTRKNLGVRTFFNVLGPLINPAQPQFQFLGVFNLKMMRLYNYVYQTLGAQYSIVHSLDGYDEVSLTDDVKVINTQGEFVYTPQELGYGTINQKALWGGATVREAAQIFQNIFDNQATIAQKDVVSANAAMAIQTICRDKSLNECKAEALYALESGAAKKALEGFLKVNS